MKELHPVTWGIRCLIAGVSILLLVGCQPQYQKQASFIEPISLSGKACMTRCSQDKVYCEQRSSQTIAGCQEAAHHRALVDFKTYQSQYDEPDRPEKTADDFYDDSACQLAVPCNRVYNQCFIHCGGRIEQVDVCVKNCPATLKPEG